MEERISNQLINIMQKDGQLTVSSREVADNFGKKHKNVIKAIEEHIFDLEKVGGSKVSHEMFIESNYENRGKEYKEYLLTRDGFSLLVMSFNNTKDVLEWKLKYIEAFNRMEEELRNNRYKLPKTYKEALICLVKAEDEKEALQEKVDELEPKADYTETILKSNGVVSINKIAKDYGKTAQEMNKKLHELGIQYKQGKQWLLYKQYQGMGYTHSNTDYSNIDNESSMHTYWTQKGRLFIYKMLKINGIVPLIEKSKKKKK